MLIAGAIETSISDSTFSKLTVLQANPGNSTMYTAKIERVTVDGSAYTGSGVRIASVGDVTLADVTVRNTRYGLWFEEETPSLLIDGLHYIANSEPLEITKSALALIRDSEFVQNVALDGAAQPGALWVRGDNAIVQVIRSTFDRNRGTSNTGGAALVENGSALVFNQSTFANNTFSAGIAASGPRGGAVGYRGSAGQTILRLIGVTLVGPTVYATGIDGTAVGGYGTQSQAQVRIFNSIVHGSCATGIDLDHVEGSISTGSNSCHFTSATNQIGATTMQLALGALGDHGGPTPTFLPTPSSVAVDKGTDYGCLTVTSDQRGYARRIGRACDVGAVETGSAAP